MRLEFDSGAYSWVVDTELGYVRQSDTEDGLVFAESTDLGLIVQLEACRLAFYEGTYGLIGVTTKLPVEVYQQVRGLSTDRSVVRILWASDTV